MKNIFKKISVTAATVLALSASAWAVDMEKDSDREKNDGRLTKNSQMSKHDELRNKQHEKQNHHLANDMFSKVDLDKNGSISRAEALAAASSDFDRKDLNKDGEISKDEIKQGYAQMKEQYKHHQQNQRKYYNGQPESQKSDMKSSVNVPANQPVDPR